MLNIIKRSFTHRHLPRWIVLTFDSGLSLMAYYAAYALRFNFNFDFMHSPQVHQMALITAVCYAFLFRSSGAHRGVIRHTNQYDTLRLIKIVVGIALLFLIINQVFTLATQGHQLIPHTVIIIQALITLTGMVSARLVVRDVYETMFKRKSGSMIRAVVYGAGTGGIMTKEALDRERVKTVEVVAFVDDNLTKSGKLLEGIPVFNPVEVFNKSFIERNAIKEVIIAIQDLSPLKKQQIIENALRFKLIVKQVPSVRKWVNGELSANQIRTVKIEDLLERDPIKLDSANIREYVTGKRVLVTGAAGSIGSEIARQLSFFKPSQLILVDQAETPLYELQVELRTLVPEMQPVTHCVIANVKDIFRMENVFEKYLPQVVFHAAAYKHVPLMEENPYEASLINVFGTKIVADLSVEHKVEKFVMISTDKAVNPTNVMGATKRVAELYTQSLNGNGGTQFITTRFGNVLGSNGSVIPLFKKQIEQGGPVTLTHKEIIRYFMTIPEACNLVLEAGAMGRGGEIYIFDMGEPVKIYDLAVKMITLSGLEPEKDIKIEVTGLRPGEKLFEELLADKENTQKTHHPKVMIARVAQTHRDELVKHLDELGGLLVSGNDTHIVGKIKQIVPEYKSQNSAFEALDKAPNMDSRMQSGDKS